MNYVVTGFDENYWERWGLSWIISLKELAKFQGTILVVDFGLPQSIKNQVKNLGAYLLPSQGEAHRLAILEAISGFAAKYPGVYAIWDADAYFQSSIDEVFELASRQIVLTESPGFFACPHDQFGRLNKIKQLAELFQDSIHNCLSYFPNAYTKIEDAWNYTQVANLQELDCQKVIHPEGRIKALMTGKKIAFWERYPDLYEKYAAPKPHTKSRLIKS